MQADEELIEDLEERLDSVATLAAEALSELDEYSPAPGASENLKTLKAKLEEIVELSAADDDDECDDEEDEDENAA